MAHLDPAPSAALPPLSAAYDDGAAPRRRPSAAGIVHLGLGNFHRAHQAVYTRAALDAAGAGGAGEAGAGDDAWGIIGVSSRSDTIPTAMKAQDLLYTVVEISPEGESFSVPGVHTDAFVGAAEPERVVASIAAAGTRIVSLTVTENGYFYSPRTGHLAVDDPAIQHDLRTPGRPTTPIGQIVRGLQERARSHGEPVTILSCDNLTDNGHHTERLVKEFAGLLPGPEAAETLAFIEDHVTFPSTMVDRIVPATTDHYRELVAHGLGYADGVPVPAEPFSMWVLEDRFAAGRPAWEAGGAVFSDEVALYEQLKVRLLNGTHSLIAYLGALCGVATISEAVSSGPIEVAARTVLREEYLPSVTAPRGVDLAAYEEQLFVRWRNTALGHRTSQVGTDGSVKLRQRVPAPALSLLDAGTMPHFLALTTAAYLACLAPLKGFDPGPHAAAMVDPARPMLARAAAESATGHDLARRVLRDHHLLGEALAGRDDFIQRTGELLDTIHRHGASAAAAEAGAAAANR
ncbi:mannitol dehydrogenase family protein [Sinomonas sp. ASV322]|uniref:mannitol dehydrogenase family protein n=1 Tax=Sinomonas sp. ASV322 TaxID=3041920 RepID=UPI0027DC63CA|nr:mannitol dehydrogenase family protein [Sinomonas sp. ASV322]MDQ4502537.1 mannitol dehydrogenase family protein [Sinomonas sp. ASV322]